MKVSKFKIALSCSTAAITLLCAAPAWAQTKTFDIPSEDAGKSIPELASQAGVQIVAPGERLHSVTTPAIKGTMDVRAALGVMLKGTDVKIASDTGQTIVLAVTPKNVQAASNEAALTTNNFTAETVTVTGTRIPGLEPVGSPVTTYNRDAITRTGAGTIEQFARTMTENFSGADTISNAYSNAGRGAFSQSSSFNQFGGSSFDLHGVGPSATLTLLNGERLSPAGVDGSITDISLIPLSVIERVEVLDDGASSIYGADAVAGVVNIITRKDFDGSESNVHYATSTAGGANEITVSQLLGHSWSTGNVMVDYEYDNQGGLDASQRDYIGSQGGPYTLVPASNRNSLFASAEQSIGPGTTISATALYSNRDFRQNSYLSSPPSQLFEGTAYRGLAKQFSSAADIHQKFDGDWTADLTINYSKLQQSFADTLTGTIRGRVLNSTGSEAADSNVFDVGIVSSGSLFSIAAGDVRAAVGASYKAEGFSGNSFSNNAVVAAHTFPAVRRSVSSLYGELFIPLVDGPTAMPGLRKLELSASARFDAYSDFGSTANPKLGVLWKPFEELDVRGSYGTSFHAPQLSQLASPITSQTSLVPNPNLPANGTTDTLLLSGGNPSLLAEKATAYTAGIDFRPDWLSDLDVGITYFNIRFGDRIETPPVSGLNYFSAPVLAPYLTLNPALAAVQSYFTSPYFQGDFATGGATAVKAIFNSEFTNIAVTRTSGLQLRTAYSLPTEIGTFKFTASSDLLFENSFQSATSQPVFALLNTYAEPAKWKGRTSLSWTVDGFSVMATMNYVGSYQNTLYSPAIGISSWTTADVYMSYDTGDGPEMGVWKSMIASVSLQNVTDERPPFASVPTSLLHAGQNPIPFDPANASPVGRLISLQLTKRF